jgi:DNA polymerase-1
MNMNFSAFDIETTGLEAYKDSKIFAFCCAFPCFDSAGKIIDCKIDIFRLDNTKESKNEEARRYLFNYFQDTSIEKIAHNAKFEISFLSKYMKIPEKTVWHDTMIMSQLLRNLSPQHSLDYLAWELCGYDRTIDKKVSKTAASLGKRYDKINPELMRDYQYTDGERTLLLYCTMIDKIKADKKLYADYRNEIELIKVTQKMEERGILLDKKNVEELESFLKNEIESVRDATKKLLGEFVNLKSDKQVARIIYRDMKYPILQLTDNETAPRPSTDKDALVELKNYKENPIFDLILKYRSYSGALATIEGYKKAADENNIIHPNILTNQARTGRQSCRNPNLQNVAKEEALKNAFPVPLRKCFRAKAKHFLIPCDYSGIEMRLIASASGEQELIDILNKSGDVHHPTVECFNMPKIFNFVNDDIYMQGIETARKLKADNLEVYSVQRSAFKNTGFCIAYGGGVGKVAVVLMRKLEDIIIGDANYRKRFPRVANFTKTLIEEVRRKHFIETSLGRKLYIPLDKAYTAANYRIQGTAAQILKLAEVRVHQWLKKRKLLDYLWLVLPVHDEILFSASRSLLPELFDILREISGIMTDIPEVGVKLEVEYKMTALDWNSARKIKL